MLSPWLIGFLAWLVPGLGHFLQGRVVRGVVSSLTILVMFFLGVTIGGHIYGLSESGEGLLSSLFGLCDMGSGLLYLLSRLAGLAVNERPEQATSEYGSVFLMVAGLLNLILALDAFDIRAGRKA
jgi:TM2 domain-containing membrane protein YozV